MNDLKAKSDKVRGRIEGAIASLAAAGAAVAAVLSDWGINICGG